MSRYFDELETRTAAERAASIAQDLPKQIARAQGLSGYGGRLSGFAAEKVTRVEDLAALPVLRKSDLGGAQKASGPFGGLTTRPASGFAHIFQSPGPIYEPGGLEHDWWRMGRFLHAAGVGQGDIVQNCFGYHLTPAGMIFESGARAVGAAVLPAGTGQTELQVTAAQDVGVTAYAGTPDFLKVILDKADELGVTLGIKKAAVGGGALFPSLRQYYIDRGSEVDDAAQFTLSANGKLNGDSVGLQAVLDLTVHLQEVSARAVHLVDEHHAGNAVAIRLTPDGFRLGLNTTHSTEDGDHAVQHTHGALHLDGEVHVTRGINDIDPVVVPAGGNRSSGDGDAPLALLGHPIGHGGAVMHLTDLVHHT